jgi:hypothetical protein
MNLGISDPNIHNNITIGNHSIFEYKNIGIISSDKLWLWLCLNSINKKIKITVFSDNIFKINSIHDVTFKNINEIDDSYIIINDRYMISDIDVAYDYLHDIKLLEKSCFIKKFDNILEALKQVVTSNNFKLKIPLEFYDLLPEKSKNIKISFCTTCMDRTHHLKLTIDENLKTFKNYNYEFLILNYNSKDDLDEFIKNYKNIKYYKTTKPKYFYRSHAKNCIHRAASGDILINLDADNFITDDYIKLSLISYFICENIVINPNGSDTFGKIVISKKVFYEIGGYDEEFKGYGEEDRDLINRARNYGCHYVYTSIDNKNTIKHDDEERLSNQDPSKSVNDKLKMLINLNNKTTNSNKEKGVDWGIL